MYRMSIIYVFTIIEEVLIEQDIIDGIAKYSTVLL